jgi:hypothetical protein
MINCAAATFAFAFGIAIGPQTGAGRNPHALFSNTPSTFDGYASASSSPPHVSAPSDHAAFLREARAKFAV